MWDKRSIKPGPRFGTILIFLNSRLMLEDLGPGKLSAIRSGCSKISADSHCSGVALGRSHRARRGALEAHVPGGSFECAKGSKGRKLSHSNSLDAPPLLTKIMITA
jgi:hypothetical protein